MLTTPQALEHWLGERVVARNPVSQAFFGAHAARLARACREMAERFLAGGRLLAFGQGAYATDAQHVSVEFVHPVIVGKRALPALDLSLAFASWVPAVVRPRDIVMGFGPPAGDEAVLDVLARARACGAMTFALPGGGADFGIPSPSDDPFIHQEMIEVLYHTLWETVHVFFEHRELGYDAGASGFLYPFLGSSHQDLEPVVNEVAASILMKASDDERLRQDVARTQAAAMARAVLLMDERLTRGGQLIFFGNGGSATDANDWALDCVMPPAAARPVAAVSLSLEPANITAIANDIGRDEIFARQLIAQARPEDVAVGISTSGGSSNVLLALTEARKRGLATIALLGYDGGEVVRRGLADVAIVVHSDYIPRIQEVQATIYHVLREALDRVGSDGS
jgi:D-sedoheptulose 7-phosphate isomerase